MKKKKYLDGPFSKWIKEDIESVYKARDEYLKDDMKYYKRTKVN